MFTIGINSVLWTLAPGAYEAQAVNVPAVDYLNAIVAHTMVTVDNSGNPITDAQIEILPPGSTSMGSYCHAVPAYPLYKTIKAGAKDIITIPELFATAADYTITPPTEVPKPPFPATSYSRGVKNVGTVSILVSIKMAGMGFPIDWAGTSGPWFTWGRT